MPVGLIAVALIAIVLGVPFGGLGFLKPAIHLAIVSGGAAWLFRYCMKPEHRDVVGNVALGVAIAMPLVVFSLPKLFMLQIVMLLWVPMIARGAFERVVPVYLFSMLLIPPLDMSVAVGSLKLFEFGMLDALGFGAGAVIMLNPQKGRPGAQWDAVALGIVIMIAAALSRDTSFSNFLRASLNVMIDLGLPYYVVSRGIRSVKDVERTTLWLACGAVVFGAILGYEALRTWPMYNDLYGKYGVPMMLIVKARAGMLRAGGPFMEPTSAAMVLAMFTLALWVCRDHFRSWMYHMALLSIAIFGLYAPQSRGAWIGLCIAILASDMIRGRFVPLMGKMIVIGGGAMALFTAAQFSPHLSESLGLSGNSSDTSEYRRMLLERGMEEFWRSPIYGYSTPQILGRLEDLRQGEGIIDFVNTYIWIMLIGGSLGILMFVGGFVIFLGALATSRPAQIPRLIAPTAFAFGCLLMVAEMLIFTSFGGRPAFYLFGIFGFSAALLGVRRWATADEVPAVQQPQPAAMPLVGFHALAS